MKSTFCLFISLSFYLSSFSQTGLHIFHHSPEQSNGIGIKYKPSKETEPTTVFTNKSNTHVVFDFDKYTIDRILDSVTYTSRVNERILIDIDPKTRNIVYWIDESKIQLTYDSVMNDSDSKSLMNVLERSDAPLLNACYHSAFGNLVVVAIFSKKKPEVFLVYAEAENDVILHAAEN